MEQSRSHSLEGVLNACRAVALSSPGCGPRNCYRVGAVIFHKSGKIVTAKTNGLKTHAKLFSHTAFPVLHAETHCIISRGLENCSGYSLMVSRVTKSGNFTMAAPCEVCSKWIKMANFKRVYYTDWEGRLQRYGT